MNRQSTKATPYARQRWLRWLIPALAVILILLYEWLEIAWLSRYYRDAWIALDVLILVILTAIAIGATERLGRVSSERSQLLADLSAAQEQLGESNQRQAAVLRISQMLSEATDEREIVEQALKFSIELVRAKGASFVPLDEHDQPQAAISLGEIPAPIVESWIEYLASPTIRRLCVSCKNQEQMVQSCPLVRGSGLDDVGIYCLPLRRGEQEFGVLNLYIPREIQLSRESQSFLKTLIEGASLALESVRLRKRFMTMLRQLQFTREKADLAGMLSGLLQDLHDTLDADYGQVTVLNWHPNRAASSVASGELPEKTRQLLSGILDSVIASKEPLLFGDVAGDAISSPVARALMAVPLLAQDQTALGAILVASRRSRAFNQNQLATLQAIAGQVALVIQNVNLLTQLEYETLVQERTRLAREIHDGLAQTLGFLKLKIAQMIHLLANGDVEAVKETATTCYEVLAEAYQDARQAIDGLRILPSEEGLSGWLPRTIREFEESSGIQAILIPPLAQVTLPPEVHAQLIRIVQEALSNVRKHSRATRVEVTCQDHKGDLILEVQDNGSGFCPQDVPTPSQHGLRGMRERAELIGADFQVIALPDRGTTVRVRLPQVVKEDVR